ncbi:unnamed protein product [Rotaria sordida]|uniref:Uncharacterized protein n=2 Tax=Rotaria sordida TaxID=392033 RepID=A0A814M7H3_9BILA|nr:unnamed protein product [Rotaria sordida]
MERIFRARNYPYLYGLGLYGTLTDSILDRFCSQILLQIHHKIEWLNLEPTSMERILRARNYPYLYGLGLYGVSIEQAISLIKNTAFTSVVKNQILSLFIDISKDKKISEIDDNKTI